MENTYEDDTSITPETSASSMGVWLAVLLGLIGAGLGGTALYFIFTGQTSVAELNLHTVSQGETLTTLENRLYALEQNLSSIEKYQQDSQKGLNVLARQTQDGFQSISDQFAAAREAVQGNTDRIQALFERFFPEEMPNLAATTPSSGIPEEIKATGGVVPPSTPDNSDPSATDTIYYRIQPGDTLTKIARDHELSLSALFDANPEINPNRLQIGQKIHIPKPSNTAGL